MNFVHHNHTTQFSHLQLITSSILHKTLNRNSERIAVFTVIKVLGLITIIYRIEVKGLSEQYYLQKCIISAEDAKGS